MTFDASNLDERLAAVADKYRETIVREPGELPPDGEYQARVESFDFFESRNGELFLKTIMSVVAGADDWEGCEAATLHSMEAEERLQFLKRHLRNLGVENPDELLGLRPRLAKAVGAIVDIRVKTSSSTDSEGRPYRNVYVNGRVSSPPDVPINTGGLETAAAGAGRFGSDDDIPF